MIIGLYVGYKGATIAQLVAGLAEKREYKDLSGRNLVKYRKISYHSGIKW